MSLRIRLTCIDGNQPTVQDVSSFLWGLSLVHDRLMLAWENPTNPVLYSPDFYRSWRKLPSGLELKLGLLSKQSPLTIELIVATAGGIMVVATSFAELLKLIRDWSLDRRKQELEIMRVRFEIIEKAISLNIPPELIISIDKDMHKILSNNIKIVDVQEARVSDE